MIAPVPEVKPYRRRSRRLPRRFPVVLRWHDLDGNPREELAETVQISRYGGLLESPTAFKPGEDVLLFWPEREKETRIRIVYRELGHSGEVVALAFEFLDGENFWEIDFPPEMAPWELPG